MPTTAVELVITAKRRAALLHLGGAERAAAALLVASTPEIWPSLVTLATRDLTPDPG